MYIYLDETFNLKKGTKNQFLAIAGYSTENPRSLVKIFAQVKKSKLPNRLSNSEIKSTDRIAEKLVKPFLFPQIAQTDISIYCNLQHKNSLPSRYYRKDKLNYDQLYLDLLFDLLIKRWQYQDSEIIIMTLDTFKTKKIDKSKIIKHLKEDLKKKYPKKNFQINFESSASSLNLQLADFICSVFYDKVLGNKQWFRLLKPKFRKITENPLS